MRVICSYETQEDNEINLVEGEYISEVEPLDDGWWKGTTQDGKRGLFLASYVEESAPRSKGEVPPLPLLPLSVRSVSNTMTSSIQKPPPSQKKRKRKGKGGDDDSKFSKAPQPASNARGSSTAARNRFLLLDQEEDD